MDSDLKTTVDRLQSAILLVMDPLTPSHLRREASEVFELVVGKCGIAECGMRKVKCGIENCGNGCGMVFKMRKFGRSKPTDITVE